QHNAWTLESISNIKNLRDDPEAVSNIKRRSQHTRVVAERSAQHLPEITLLRFGGNPRGWTGPLTVDDHHWSLHHGGQAQPFTPAAAPPMAIAMLPLSTA